MSLHPQLCGLVELEDSLGKGLGGELKRQEAAAVRDSTCLSQDCCWKGWVPGAPIVQVHRSPKAGTR